MAGREVGICLGLGLPAAVAVTLKPIRVGGSILGTDCGPAWAARARASVDPSASNYGITEACRNAAAPWIATAVLVALVAVVLALVLGISVKRPRARAAAAPSVAVPPGWVLDARGWWSPPGWEPPPGWVCPPPGYAGKMVAPPPV